MSISFANNSVDAGEILKEFGLVQGDDNGNLNEEGMLTRAEMMVVLSRLLGVEQYKTELV